MLLALGGSLQADMASMVTTVSTAVQDLSLRMYPTETKISDTCHAHNDLVDGFSDRDTALYLINAKLADLEDQFWRNYKKKNWGIPKTVTQPLFHEFLCQLWLLISLLTGWIRSLSRLSFQIPSSVLMRIHFYHAKEQAMTATGKKPKMSKKITGISLYANLSAATTQARHQLSTIMKTLCNHKIVYQWICPTKLLITYQGKRHAICSIDKGQTCNPGIFYPLTSPSGRIIVLKDLNRMVANLLFVKQILNFPTLFTMAFLKFLSIFCRCLLPPVLPGDFFHPYPWVTAVWLP